MSTPTFAATHNLVAFLEKPIESEGFEQIIDFLKAKPIRYALTVNPTVYTLCIKQFWATAKVQRVNAQEQIQALVDKKKVIINEESIRRDLKLEDAEGSTCLPNATIFEELARMGYEKPSQRLTFYKAFFSPQWKFLIHTILQCLSAKTTTWNEFSSTMAFAIIYLANNQKFNFSKYILDNLIKNLEGGVKFFMFLRFLQVFLNNQVEGMNKYKETFVVSSHTKKNFANIRQAYGFSGDVTPLFDSMMVQATEEVDEALDYPLDQPSTSSIPQKKQKPRRTQRQVIESPQHESADEDHVLDLQKAKDAQANVIASLKNTIKKLQRKRRSRPAGLRKIKKIGARKSKSSMDMDKVGDHEGSSKQGRNIDDSVQDEAQEQLNEEEMFSVDDLHSEEVTIEDTVDKVIVQDTTAEIISTTETVTAAKEVKTVSGPTTTIDELTLAQTLVEITAKSKKVEAIATAATSVTTVAVTRPIAKGIVFHELEQTHRPTVSSIPPSSKDKGKAIMIEPERPLKRKEQVVADEEYVKQLAAKMEAEEAKKAIMEANRLLAERLQAREREELIIEEKSKLFVELMNKRKKHFAELRAQEIRNKPPTKSQKRNQMSTYLKNMGTWKHFQLKSKSYEEIERFFEIEMKRVNTFIPMNQDEESSKNDKAESKFKRAGEELESDMSKKQKTDEQVEVEVDDTTELKRCLDVVPEDEDDVTVDATPLSSRLPSIVDYKIHKEGKKKHFQIIRADGNSKYYLTFGQMFKNFNRDDLEDMWKIVKSRFMKKDPVDDMDNLLLCTLNTMFEPQVEDTIWTYQQGLTKVKNWKLYDSCGLLLLIAEKVHPEKKQQDKLKEVKARLNIEGCSRRNSKIQEESQYSESKTTNTKEQPEKRRRSRRSCSPQPNPSVFSRIRRDKSVSPMPMPREKERREGGVFNRLDNREKSVSAHSESHYQNSCSRGTEGAPKKRHREGALSRITKAFSESKESGGGH
ncbi:hypothetical protein Tco_1194082 [Tanacetum coccineum]